jgi:uncharacterized membrane protein
MTQILTALSTWLHTIATAIFIGHFLLLSLVYIPALGNSSPALLSDISKRSRPWLYLAILLFALTGTYLTMTDSGYLGLANFGNFWSILMLVKHLLLLGMIGMGFWFNAIMRVGPMMSSNSGAAAAVARFRWYVNLMTIAGVLVLLLTTVSQSQ